MEAALRSLIDWYERAGVDVPPLAPAKPARKKRSNIQEPNALKTTSGTTTKSSIKPRPNAPTAPEPQVDATALIEAAAKAARKAQNLDELRAALQSFDAGRLSDNARGAVFARGNPAAKLMVIGEAPSAEDDNKGEPFMGREGELLARMLGAIGLTENDYYLALTVNWRLPKNRTAKPEEIDICRPFLRRHIELAAPSCIVLLGSTPLIALTDVSRIMREHGQWKSVKIGEQDIPALPIYPPSTLLTQADLKKDAWRDLLALRTALEAATLKA